MTYNDIINIAKKLDKETQKRIDADVEDRVEILKEGDLSKEDMEKMEECLYMSLVLQEYLSGEYELLEEEKALLLAEMEELFNEYGELLSKAKLEEKLSKKKRMALYLMKIREELFEKKEKVKDVDERMKNNQENQDKLKDDASKENMKKIAEDNKDKDKVMGKNKKDLPNPDKMNWGLDNDSGRVVKPSKSKEGDLTAGLRDANKADLDKQREAFKNDAANNSFKGDGDKIIPDRIKEDIDALRTVTEQGTNNPAQLTGQTPSTGVEQGANKPTSQIGEQGRSPLIDMVEGNMTEVMNQTPLGLDQNPLAQVAEQTSDHNR